MTLCLPGAGVLAQTAAPAPPPATARLDRVTVVAPGPLSGAELERDRLAAPVFTASGDDLARSGATDLSDFLSRRAGGVHVNGVQGNPLQPDLNFRGFTASPLLGSAQGLTVWLDGVRLNQPFGDVVSWDLVPTSAIASIALMPGSNPLFGLNTLGGAVSVRTKDGRNDPGVSATATFGRHGRRTASFEAGGASSDDAGWQAFATGEVFRDGGWRVASPSAAERLFGKVGRRLGATEVTATAAVARSDLTGNGLQDARLLAADRSSVYTRPDTTTNRAWLAKLDVEHRLAPGATLTAQAFARRIRTTTLNGDMNDDSLDQATTQPTAAERAALTRAGYTGFPTAGETAANTPFPKWRCIAQALLVDEPAEKCNGVINRTRTDQRQWGAGVQWNVDGTVLGRPARSMLGAGVEASRIHFVQGSELGYLEADRSVTGVGAFGDGVTGGDIDGEPYDTRVDLSGRVRTASLYGSSTVTLAPATHLTVAGRWNRTTIRNRDAITPGGGGGSLDGDHTYARLNPAVGLTFVPVAGVQGWVGANQGSRAPSSVELGCADPANPCKLPNAFAGDPPLRQVVTTTLEAGVRGRLGTGGRWSVGVFRADNRDDLLFVADDAAGFGYFRNVSATRRQGLEASVAWKPSAAWSLDAQFTLLDATFRSAEVVGGASNSANSAAQAGFPGVDGTIRIAPGDRIPLVPRGMLKLGVDWTPAPAWTVSADVNATGGATARGNENGAHQPDGTYYLGPGRSAGYALLNLGVRWQPQPAVTLFARLDNALNRAYETAAQLGATGLTAAGTYQSRPFPANANGDRPLRHATFLAPGAPRTLVLGLTLRFDGP